MGLFGKRYFPVITQGASAIYGVVMLLLWLATTIALFGFKSALPKERSLTTTGWLQTDGVSFSNVAASKKYCSAIAAVWFRSGTYYDMVHGGALCAAAIVVLIGILVVLNSAALALSISKKKKLTAPGIGAPLTEEAITALEADYKKTYAGFQWAIGVLWAMVTVLTIFALISIALAGATIHSLGYSTANKVGVMDATNMEVKPECKTSTAWANFAFWGGMVTVIAQIVLPFIIRWAREGSYTDEETKNGSPLEDAPYWAFRVLLWLAIVATVIGSGMVTTDIVSYKLGDEPALMMASTGSSTTAPVNADIFPIRCGVANKLGLTGLPIVPGTHNGQCLARQIYDVYRFNAPNGNRRAYGWATLAIALILLVASLVESFWVGERGSKQASVHFIFAFLWALGITLSFVFFIWASPSVFVSGYKQFVTDATAGVWGWQVSAGPAAANTATLVSQTADVNVLRDNTVVTFAFIALLFGIYNLSINALLAREGSLEADFARQKAGKLFAPAPSNLFGAPQAYAAVPQQAPGLHARAPGVVGGGWPV